MCTPQALAQLPVLERLWLDENDISGAVPTWLGNMPSLTSIDLFANDLSGDLPLQDLAKRQRRIIIRRNWTTGARRSRCCTPQS